MKTFKEFFTESRQPIDWDSNYGKTFKIVHTPKGRQSTGATWTPDLVSVVTPENEDAWTSWKEVPSTLLTQWKSKWNQIQKSLGQHKYDQIIRSQHKLNESVLLELFQSFPNIKTKANWVIEPMKDYDSEGGVRAEEVTYYTTIKNKIGKPVIYEYNAVVAIPKPDKEPSKRELLAFSKLHIDNLPAAEITFKTINDPKHGGSISMVGDADVSSVLNNAMAFIKDIIENYKVNLVSFSASGKSNLPEDEMYSSSREKVYERLIKKFADRLGFTHTKKSIFTTQPGHGTHDATDFVLTRKNPIHEKNIHDPVRPGILKRQVKGKVTCSKARALHARQKNKNNATAKAARRFQNYHCQ